MASTLTLPTFSFAAEQKNTAEQLFRRLPALPTVAARLLGMMGRADVNFKDVSNLIVSDATLTVEILRMSNSAMFSVRNEVRNILQALAVLGSEKVKGLVCTVALRSYLGNALQIPALKRCWRHNLATAVVSSEIAEWARQDSGEAYTAGILHDIGRLGLIAHDPAKYLQVLDRAATEGGLLSYYELESYGLDSDAAGEWLASSWGLPISISSAIRDQCLPMNSHFDPVTGLISNGCKISDALGFSILETGETNDTLIHDFVEHLPAAYRERLKIDIPEFQILIASRVNALES